VLLSIGCELRLHCEAPTPLLVLVHPHRSLVSSVRCREVVELQPDRSFELLTDGSGNRWSRLIAASGLTTFRYGATIERPDSTDPVLPATPACPVQALPIDTYRFLNASTYCDTPALMDLAWRTFGNLPAGWPQVQGICDWVHQRIRFDYGAVAPHQSASDTLAAGAGVCRDFAHLGLALCRALQIPARMVVGYLHELEPMDQHAWFEPFVGGRWFTFDATQLHPKGNRVAVAYGRDAADVAIVTQFGPVELTEMGVFVVAAAPVAGTGCGPR
jgi:transglutaminase-like putative cysteine protease